MLVITIKFIPFRVGGKIRKDFLFFSLSFFVSFVALCVAENNAISFLVFVVFGIVAGRLVGLQEYYGDFYDPDFAVSIFSFFEIIIFLLFGYSKKLEMVNWQIYVFQLLPMLIAPSVIYLIITKIRINKRLKQREIEIKAMKKGLMKR